MKKLYSPRIRRDLIPVLYTLAKINKIPMTRLVNEIIIKYLKEIRMVEP